MRCNGHKFTDTVRNIGSNIHTRHCGRSLNKLSAKPTSHFRDRLVGRPANDLKPYRRTVSIGRKSTKKRKFYVLSQKYGKFVIIFHSWRMNFLWNYQEGTDNEGKVTFWIMECFNFHFYDVLSNSTVEWENEPPLESSMFNPPKKTMVCCPLSELQFL